MTNQPPLPPQNLEAERAVIGAMMLGTKIVDEAIGSGIESGHFYRQAHSRIFDAIISLSDKNVEADLLTVSNELKSAGHLETVGGNVYLSEILDSVDTTGNVGYHAKIIKDKFVLRELINYCQKTVSEAYREEGEPSELLDKHENSIYQLSSGQVSKDFVHIKEPVKDVWNNIEAAYQNVKEGGDGILGERTGFKELDDTLGGLNGGDFVIVAARPSMGKTAFCLDVGRYVAKGKSVGIFSLEMSAIQLTQRAVCSVAKIDGQLLKRGKAPASDLKRLGPAVSEVSNLDIHIDDTPGLTSLQLRTKARRLASKTDIGLVVIDYLQLMSGHTGSDNRQQEISQISRALKALAMELNVPVVALSQLSRAVETRGGDHRPMLSDLRESGALEQDADVVLFIYRGERYGNEEDAGTAEIIVGKQRNGPIGTIRLGFDGRYTTFSDLD